MLLVIDSINIKSSPNKSVIKRRIFIPEPRPTKYEQNKDSNAQNPHRIDNTGNPLKHLQLNTGRFRLTDQDREPIDGSNTVINDAN